jgi:hypothetical protein
MDAAEDFHEGGFAGAVLADEGQDFAAGDAQMDVVQRDHAGETLADAAQFEERRRGGGWDAGFQI